MLRSMFLEAVSTESVALYLSGMFFLCVVLNFEFYHIRFLAGF